MPKKDDEERLLTLVREGGESEDGSNDSRAPDLESDKPSVRAQTRRAVKRQTRLERRRDVLQLRAAGATVEQIAQALDIGKKTVGVTLKAIYEEWEDEIADLRGQVLGLELHRLDELLQNVWPRALNRAPRGKEAPYTWADQREAIETVLRLMERRSRFLGLDAPDKFVHEHLVHHEVADAGELKRLEALRTQRALPADVTLRDEDIVELPALSPPDAE